MKAVITILDEIATKNLSIKIVNTSLVFKKGETLHER